MSITQKGINRFGRRAFVKSSLSIAPLPLLSACQTETSSKQIVMGVASRPRMLDPRKATDALSSRINRLIYRQLIDFNDAFEPIPDLADWQQLSNTHYRFTLLSQPDFHHGKVLTAKDVEATYQSVLDPALGSPHRGSLINIQKVEAINESEVDFWLTEPDALFVGRLVIGIVPADMVAQKHPFQSQPIGCGVCRFISLSEQKLVLQRPDKVRLVFMPVKDATVRVLKLRKGELDLVQNDLSPELVSYCQHHEGLKVKWQKGTSFGYIGFNFEDALLSDLNLREAIAYGINRSEIIDAIFEGQARLAGGLLVPEHWSGAPEINGYPYRPELAKQKIEAIKTGLTNAESASLLNEQGNIVLSYKTSSDPTRIRLATIYQSQLKRIGIQLKIQSYDWGTFYNDIKQGRFQLYSLAWVGVKSPDIFQYVFASDAIPPNGANRGRYKDKKADALIVKASQEKTMAQQAEDYRALQVHLQQTLAALPLWYENQYAVMRDHLTGFELFADGRFDGLLKTSKKHF